MFQNIAAWFSNMLHNITTSLASHPLLTALAALAGIVIGVLLGLYLSRT